MYRAGDRIIYGGSGVCQVKAVGPLEGDREDRLYYTLEPLYGSGIIYAPVDGPVFSRPLMTPEEVHDLLAQFPEIPAEPLAERSLTALKDRSAQELLHGEIAAVVGIPLDSVPDYIRTAVEGESDA